MLRNVSAVAFQDNMLVQATRVSASPALALDTLAHRGARSDLHAVSLIAVIGAIVDADQLWENCVLLDQNRATTLISF